MFTIRLKMVIFQGSFLLVVPSLSLIHWRRATGIDEERVWWTLPFLVIESIATHHEQHKYESQPLFNHLGHGMRPLNAAG